MQFIITAYDGDNMLEKRMAVRPRHLEGMAALSDHIVCAGGLLDEYLDNEPYVLEHVWERVEVEAMNVVILDGRKVGK